MASRRNEIKTNIEANSEGFVNAIDDVKRSISTTRIEFANINSLMKSTGDTTEQLSEHKKQLQEEITKTENNLAKLKDTLEIMTNKEGASAESIKITREEMQKASTHYEELKQKLKLVNDKLDEQTSSLESLSQGFSTISDVTGKFASKVKWLSAGAGSILGMSIKTAIDLEDAFVGVKKTVEGTDEELENIRVDLVNLSKQIPISTSELFALAEEAGQLGIKTEDITDFTETMAKLGTATNLSATEAGESIATFVNVMGTLPENYERIGSVIVELGNNSKATESDIISMAQRMSGAGATLGMSEASILGLATALSSVGLEAEMGGTAMSRVMNDFNRAASGVETKYGSLSQYAQICGYSTEEFADKVKNDAGEALKEFIMGLGDTNRTGQSTIELMSDLGINEVRLTDTMLRLANAGGTVDQYMDMANNEWRENNALTTEAEKRYADTASQVEITKNRFGEVADKLGKVLLPIVNDGLKWLGELADKFSNLDSNTQKTIVGVLLFTTALAPISKVVSTITKGISNFTKIVDKTATPLKTLYRNITDVDSRTVSLNKNVNETNGLLGKMKTNVDKVSSSNKSLGTTFSNVGTKIKNTTKNIKEGVNYWYQTTSGVDKLKTGLTGLVGTVASVKGFSTAIGDIADEGANVANVSGAVVGGLTSIIGGMTTGASVGGVLGGVLGGIGSAIGLIVGGTNSWKQANDVLVPYLDSTQETFNNFKTNLDGINDSYNQVKEATVSNSTEQLTYIGNIEKLSSELGNLMDTNGKVKDSDTERANVIMNLLNKELGTQLTLEDGIVKNGDAIIANKSELIDLTKQSAEEIKKEILLQGYQETYKAAIEAQTKAKREYQQALTEENDNLSELIEKYNNHEISALELDNALNESNKRKIQAQKDYDSVMTESGKIVDGLTTVTENYATSTAEQLQTTINSIMGANIKAVEENTTAYENAYATGKKLANDQIQMAKQVKEEAKKERDDLNNSFKTSPVVMQVNTTQARANVNNFIKDYNRVANSTISSKAMITGLASLAFSSAAKIQTLPTIQANAKGTVVTKPTLSWIGEDGAEAVVPLERNTEWIDGVADRLRTSFSGISTSYFPQNNDQTLLEEYFSRTISVLERILDKPNDLYLDGKKISDATAYTDDMASGDLLEKVERGWAT